MLCAPCSCFVKKCSNGAQGTISLFNKIGHALLLFPLEKSYLEIVKQIPRHNSFYKEGYIISYRFVFHAFNDFILSQNAVN